MSKLLIVEDNQVDRTVLAAVLSQHLPYCQLFFASDAYEARDLIAYEDPQAVLLDLELPRMSGEQFLTHLMRNYPLPVVVTGRSASNSVVTTRRLHALGAIAVVEKPNSNRDIARFAKLLCKALCDSIGICPVTRFLPPAATNEQSLKNDLAVGIPKSEFVPSLIAIGASTGGPRALEAILPHLTQDCPPVLIAQHIAESFAEDFAQRLNQVSQATVTIATTGKYAQSGHVYLAPPGKQLRLNTSYKLLVEETTDTQCFAPSVDVLFNSLAKAKPETTVAVLLTGMGDDGASGLLHLRRMGATTIAQSESSCAIFGMPKRAIDLGAAQYTLHLSAIGPTLRNWTTASPVAPSIASLLNFSTPTTENCTR